MKSRICLYLVILFTVFSLFFSLGEVYSIEEEDIFLNINVNFEFLENSVEEESFINSDSIDITLPNESWKIKDIELNFTEIDFGNDIILIEGNESHNTYKRVYNRNPGLYTNGQAVQVKLNDPSIIYGVFIYGYNLSHPGVPQIQIRGYDSINNRPNASIYASTNLNITETPGWYLQNFNSSLLDKGNYFLVLNGTSLPQSSKNDAGFYWAYNSINPNNPELFTSEYINQWSVGTSGNPFLYKLIQKVETSLYPEEINMTAQLDGNIYSVSNGKTQGKGYLKQKNINFHANKKKVDIKIKNNKTQTLKFNLSYNVNIINVFNTNGHVNVMSNRTNNWIINPEITRYSDNQTVRFDYPNSWSNILFFKDQQNITSEIIFNKSHNFLIIPNNFLENNTEWEIRANSPNIDLNINFPQNELKTGQELAFSLSSTALPGNYTFKFYDPNGIEKYQIKKVIPLDDNIFTYTIPSNAIEGNYLAYVFWNNETDAGAQSHVISIVAGGDLSPPIDFALILTIGLVIVGGVGTGYAGYIITKKVKSKHRDTLNLILESCNDVMNLEYVIILDPKTGIDLYSQPFEKKELDPTLIAGFLQAIHNFGVEVIEGAKKSKTIKVEYQESIIIMTDFVNVRLITIMKRNPSKNFLYSLENLAYHIYKYYGKLIESFNGNLIPFRSIEKLILSDLNVSIRYPLTVSFQKNVKLTQTEKKIVERALNFMKENDFNYFYVIYLIPDNTCTPKDFETILQLIKKGVFQPLDIDFDQEL
ncbi:MAG: hypothetical protein ACFFBV_07480 [Promethearchaeota archaeon]